jgi:hypothetical protein
MEARIAKPHSTVGVLEDVSEISRAGCNRGLITYGFNPGCNRLVGCG